MLAGGDSLAGKTDDLVVAADGIACLQGFGGDFVAWRNQAFGGDTFYFCAADELCPCYDDVVCCVESDEWSHGFAFVNTG